MKRHTSTPITFALILTALGMFPLAGAAGAQTSECRPADGVSQVLIKELQELMTTTDPVLINGRDNHYHVPVVSLSQITLVTDARVCDKASAAYRASAGGNVNPAVYVVKLGSKGFAVLDPDRMTGEYRTVKIFDTKWVRIGGWTGP